METGDCTVLLSPGDRNGVEPIHEAAATDCLETLKFLLKKGAKLTATDHRGRTPVHKVRYSYHMYSAILVNEDELPMDNLHKCSVLY